MDWGLHLYDGTVNRGKANEIILEETSNAKSEHVLLHWTPRLCLRFVLYDMSFVNTFFFAMYNVMNYPLLMLILVAFYAKLNKIKKYEFHFALEVSFSIY